MVGKSISEEERLSRLRLARSENVGPVTYRDLMEQFGSAADALDALPELVRMAGGKRRIKIASKADAERELKEIKGLGAQLLCAGEPDYPPLLFQADPPPPIIAVKGALHLLQQSCVALVGSRSASAAGLRMAADLAHDLGASGHITVSGLARGIDAAIHQASLATGTIAVIAGGLDNYYPEENRRLQDQIAEQGALVSEMPPGTKPQGRHFPRRNRIISGLSRGVIVVEAALRSGSLITARFALEQNRELMAVPGSPLDPRARGGNALLKQGAALVESAQDVIDWLDQAPRPHFWESEQPDYEQKTSGAVTMEETDRLRLETLLGPTPMEEDELIRLSQLPARLVKAHLSALELAGRIVREPGQKVALLQHEEN